MNDRAEKSFGGGRNMGPLLIFGFFWEGRGEENNAVGIVVRRRGVWIFNVGELVGFKSVER